MASKEHQYPNLPLTTPQFRTAYSGHVSVLTFTPGEDMTKQSFKDECDINNIMKRYQATGIIDHVRDASPQYLDATTFDFQSAQNIIAEANSIFAAMPSQLRDRFHNDPVELLEFVHNPKNAQEAVSLGFLDPARLPAGVLPAELPPAAPAPSGAVGGGKGGGSPPPEGGKPPAPPVNPLNA